MLSRNKKAFTLIELIVVLVILGIIAALAVPSFSGVKTGAAEKTAVQSAEAAAREANAIAALEERDTALADFQSGTASDGTFDIAVGNYDCDVAVSIVDGEATVGAATCA